MQYFAPATTKQAVDILSRAPGNAHLLAGGSDLLVRMKGGFVEPDLIVDIKRIASLQQVNFNTHSIAIGAGVTCAQLGHNARLKKAWPGVVEAANLIGSDQIQSRCTIVGNVCNASPAADSVPALIAAGARARISGPRGKRRLLVEKIATAPGKNCLEKGELVEFIELPKRAPRSADAYLRFIPRTEMDIAVVSAAVNLSVDNKGVVTRASVALGAVAATAVRVKQAQRALVGTTLDNQALEALGKACSSACDPIDDKRGTISFRTEVAAVLAKRAAKIAYRRAGGKS